MKISNVALLIAYALMIAEIATGNYTDVPYMFFGIALVCICVEREFNRFKGGDL